MSCEKPGVVIDCLKLPVTDLGKDGDVPGVAGHQASVFSAKNNVIRIL